MGQVLVPRAASSLVAAGEKPQAGLLEREGVWAGGALILLSRRPPWRWLGCGSQAPPTAPPPNSFRDGCQGFHRVTQILPIWGNSCPFTQLRADSAQVKWSTAEAHADYLVPSEAISGLPGEAIVARHSWHPRGARWGQGTMPSVLSVSIVSRKEDWAPSSKSYVRKWWSWDSNPRQYRLLGCGDRGSMRCGVHSGLASGGLLLIRRPPHSL